MNHSALKKTSLKYPQSQKTTNINPCFAFDEASWIAVHTCLYVLSATHSRKKKIHTRDTRTTKLIITIERTRMSPFDPNAVIQSSVAECAASCSKSLAWESRKTNGIKPKIKDMTFPKI